METSSRFWGRKTAFVTGGTGFVGSWLVRELLDAGANVVVLVRHGSNPAPQLRESANGKLFRVAGDLEDYQGVLAALTQARPDTVFHLAGQSLAGIAKNDPLRTLETNLRGTWNLLEASRKSSVSQVMVASSDKAYGASSELPYKEDHPLRGGFPYDVSKSCADLIAAMYANSYGLRVGIGRFANIFGGGDLNFSRLIPDLVRTTLRGERFAIHSDGEFVRDFLYVRDAVTALLDFAEQMDRTPSLVGQAINFGLSVRVTVLEMVEKVLSLMGMGHLRPIIKNQASCETRESYLCCEKAEQLLGWRPRYSLEEGLRETIAWYQEYLGTEAHSVMEAAG
jgi:CDP-glucose 4,6-dehydratase